MIKYTWCKIETGDVLLSIKSQTFKNDSISRTDGLTLHFYNGYTLKSSSYPQWVNDIKTLFIRGSDITRNDNEIIIPKYDWTFVKAMLDDYNKKFKIKENWKMLESVKTYFEKHQEIIITVAIIILIDQFVFAGAFREKLQAIIDKMINSVTKKVEEM